MRNILAILLLAASTTLAAQNNEGLYVRFGINNGYPQWSCADSLFKEFNQLRPWLVTKPEVGSVMGGITLGYGVATEHFFFSMDYMSNRTYSRMEGIDSSGTEHKGSFMLVNRTLSLSAGLKVINTSVFRIGLFAGLSANPFVIKKIENEVIAQRAASLFLAGLLAWKWSPSPLDSKFFVSGKLGASMQIGGRYGVAIEPYYIFPFWKADLNSTRQKLNNFQSVASYTADDFKSRLSYWGVRVCFYLGTE